jgi:DNA-binding NtrC family response regulator
MDKPKLLIVDDNEAFTSLFQILPEAKGYDIIAVHAAEKALEVLATRSFDIVVSDVQMPGMSGFELFHKIQDRWPETPVILATAFGSTEDAVRAVTEGAFHYFEKPLDDKLDLFWTTVREAVEKKRLQRQLVVLEKEKALHAEIITPFIGHSLAVKEVSAAIAEIANLPVTVLISGETGTGKSLVAKLIHKNGERCDQPFFAVNCGDFAEGVLESELFGHEKGAFTGAVAVRKGIFELVHGGTLFLDEISEASLNLQSKLLRVLEEKSFARVGSATALHSDFRFLSATNRDLDDHIQKGHFRRDLFYRLNVYRIDIPPLRDRPEDLPALADFYCQKFCSDYGRKIEGLSIEALAALKTYGWPGNVRELINVIERAVITCKDNKITTRHLPFQPEGFEKISDLELKSMEKYFVSIALQRTAGNRTHAAVMLGISRKTLIDKIKKYRLESFKNTPPPS